MCLTAHGSPSSKLGQAKNFPAMHRFPRPLLDTCRDPVLCIGNFVDFLLQSRIFYPCLPVLGTRWKFLNVSLSSPAGTDCKSFVALAQAKRKDRKVWQNFPRTWRSSQQCHLYQFLHLGPGLVKAAMYWCSDFFIVSPVPDFSLELPCLFMGNETLYYKICQMRPPKWLRGEDWGVRNALNTIFLLMA